jgi:hypothetical protein
MVNMSSSSSRDSSQAATQHQPEHNDVLLGRAANVFHHPGNSRYRHVIAMNLRRYKEAKTRLDKMVLIRQVTEQVLDQGRVKFLRRDGKTGTWTQVPFRTAQDKVSHALRDGINKPIFSPLMADEETSTTVPGPAPFAINDADGNPDEMPPASLHAASAGSDGPGRRFGPSNQNPQGQRRPFFPSIRLDSMAAASASTRAALGTISTLGGELPSPHLLQQHPRSASAPHLLHQQHQVSLLNEARSPMFESRRSSAPHHPPPPLGLPTQHHMLGNRFRQPPMGLPGQHLGFLLGGSNLRAHGYQHHHKSLGHNPYAELLALKEQAQEANRLAEIAMRRQLLAEIASVQASNTATKSFLDDVVQQYRVNANPASLAFLNQQGGIGQAAPTRQRPLSRDGSVSTNDTVS